jgi:uncharacterized membrane protein
MNVYAYLAGAAVIAASAWSVQGWRKDAEIAELKLTAAESTKIAVKAALTQTEQWQSDKDKALYEANQRAQNNQAAATRASSANNSLLNELATARADMSKATEQARDKYAAAVEGVLGQCSREYQDMAAKADGHANDAIMLMEAWPR